MIKKYETVSKTNEIELINLTATEAVEKLRTKEISPLELLEASINRIVTVDKDINALPIRRFERARQIAYSWEQKKHIINRRSLCGIPIAVKDYNDVRGILTTYGSPLFKKNIAKRSDATVQKLEDNGALPIAKSNVPEWAGGHTFNPVFGVTRNPWDLRLTAGGSSGGSAAALASGQIWLATGNDLGGSLRTPASLNGVVGLRPSPGRVPRGSRLPAMDTLWVEGPMARNIEDLALMLDASIGFAQNDPLSFDQKNCFFRDRLKNIEIPKRIAYSPNLNVVAIEPEIAQICENSVGFFEKVGIEITDDIPNFTGVLKAFHTLRSVLFATMMEPMLKQHPTEINVDIVANIERGLKLEIGEFLQAERTRIDLHNEMQRFFENHDFLICPACSISPFPVENQYVKQIAGKSCETYIDWFSITFLLTMTSCPVLSIPCGFDSKGLPVGLQILGKPRGEASLLSFAKIFENEIGFAKLLPIYPRSKAVPTILK